MYLAGQGHRVVGITNEAGTVREITRTARNLGLTGCSFVEADARNLKKELSGRRFGAVLIMNVLHLMNKADSWQVVESAKHMAEFGGLNAVSGYLVDPAAVSKKHAAQMLQPGELIDYYQHEPEWQVLSYQEDPFRLSRRGGHERIYSHADLIAQRLPNTPVSPDMY